MDEAEEQDYEAVSILDYTGRGRADKTTSGKRIYATACQFCHGGEGEDGHNGIALTTSALRSVDEFVEVVTNGRKTMPAFSEAFSEEEIRAVATYAMSLRSP